LYTTDLLDATEKHGVTLHAFADDTQLPALRLLNAAARLFSNTKKFYRGLPQVMHVDLHWHYVPQRVKYKRVTMAC